MFDFISILPFYLAQILRPDNRPASAIEGVMRPQRPSDVRGTRVTLAAPKAVALEKSSVTAGPELDKRRAMIVRELFDTEKTYVIALTNLVQVRTIIPTFELNS